MKVLWMSRHQPLQSQVDELKRVLGDCEVVQDPNPFEVGFGCSKLLDDRKTSVVVQDPNPFEDASDIIERFKGGGYDEIVVVAPLSVIAKLTEAPPCDNSN